MTHFDEDETTFRESGYFFFLRYLREISKQNGARMNRASNTDAPRLVAFASGYANLFAQLVHIYQSSRGTRVVLASIRSHCVRAPASIASAGKKA